MFYEGIKKIGCSDVKPLITSSLHSHMSVRQTKDVGDLCWPHAFLYYEQKFGRTGKVEFIDIF